MPPGKNILKKFLILLSIIISLLPLSACGDGSVSGYRLIPTKESEAHRFAFRSGDPAEKLFTAALSELSYSDKIAELSARWLGGADVNIPKTQNAVAIAMASLGITEIPERDFILGVDDTAEPFSFAAAGADGFSGFDVELASAACGRLGWTPYIQAVTSFDADVELLGGNIDCAGGSLGITAETSKISVTEPYITAKYCVLVKYDSGIKNISQLDGKKITLRDDLETINALLEGEEFAGLSYDKEYLKTIGDCVNALGAGRCDAVLLCEYAAKYKVN